MGKGRPGYSFQQLDTVDALPDVTPRPLADVQAAFARLHESGDLIAVGENGMIKGERYTYKNYGDSRADIHFQGMQRARDGIHAFVTGGDSIEPAAHLFVLRLGTRSPLGPWGSNTVHWRSAPEQDAIACVVALSAEHWHGGGPAVLGDLLAIPLEGSGASSRTIFLDVSVPEHPVHIPRLDITAGRAKVGAAALARLPNGHLLCGLYRDEPTQVPSGWLELYALDTTRPDARFSLLADYAFADAAALPRKCPKYQATAFLQDANGQLYFIASENTSPMAPYKPGQDIVDLYRVQLAPVALEYIATRTLSCQDGHANFDAVGGVHVDAFGRLIQYGGYHWRVQKALRLTEFRERVGTDAPAIAQIEAAWIELYEHSRFSGNRLSILGLQDAEIPDYRRISVQGNGFNDRLSAVRWQLPAGWTYRLYGAPEFRENEGFIDLAGDGQVHEIADLAQPPHRFQDRVTSSRFLPRAVV